MSSSPSRHFINLYIFLFLSLFSHSVTLWDCPNVKCDTNIVITIMSRLLTQMFQSVVAPRHVGARLFVKLWKEPTSRQHSSTFAKILIIHQQKGDKHIVTGRHRNQSPKIQADILKQFQQMFSQKTLKEFLKKKMH